MPHRDPSRPARLHPAPLALAFALAFAFAGCGQPPNPPSTLGASFNVRTEQGWTGRRFTINQHLLAEEYDTDGDERIDLWRFYSGGFLVSEERDLLGHGRIDHVAAWEGASRRLLSAARDSQGRGVFDLQVEHDGPAGAYRVGRWRIARDANADGFADLLLTVEGPPSLFADLGIDLATVDDLAAVIPAQYWREWRADDGTGRLGPYLRYLNGQPTHRATVIDDRGTPVAWEPIPPGADPSTLAPPINETQFREQREAARRAAIEARATSRGGSSTPRAGTGPQTGTLDALPPVDGTDGVSPSPDLVASPDGTGRGTASSQAGGRRGGSSPSAGRGTAPVPSSAVDRALQRRRNAPAGMEGGALAYPDGMQVRPF